MEQICNYTLRKGYGYDVEYLVEFFRETLDQNEETDIALVGVGSLGTAFLNYNFLKNHNTRIVIAFDSEAPIEGETISGIPVFHPVMIEEKPEELGIEILPRKFFARTVYNYPGRNVALNFYLCDWITGKPVRHDCHDFRWVYPNELRNYRFPPADTELINELIRKQTSYFSQSYFSKKM